MTALLPALFCGGETGAFLVERMTAVAGQPLASVARLAVFEGVRDAPESSAAWSLRGCTGHVRYVQRTEQAALSEVTPPLGRPEATCAALIPIRKRAGWWALPQDERRAILEERSHHIAIGLDFLPAIARRLYHSRELGEDFDFLTWFEFAPEDAGRFDDLVGRLRETEEWTYVEREVELRLVRQRA